MEERRHAGAASWTGKLMSLCKELAEENAELRAHKCKLKEAHDLHLTRLDELRSRVDGLILRTES